VTLRKEVWARGVGLHSGAAVAAVLRPARRQGLVIRRSDGPGAVLPLASTLVRESPLCTLLQDDNGTTVSTVEHLMSALHALRVDCLDVELDGPEVPILDGSALPWVELIDAAGRQETAAPRQVLQVRQPALHDSEGRVLAAEPDPRGGLRVACVVEFAHPAIRRQEWQGRVDEAVYRREIAPARTFVLEKDIAAAQAAGLAKGGSLDNAVVFGDDGTVKNPGGLRFADEPVRHKVLDFVGDIYMAGRVVEGRFHLTAPGHVANNRLLRKIEENAA